MNYLYPFSNADPPVDPTPPIDPSIKRFTQWVYGVMGVPQTRRIKWQCLNSGFAKRGAMNGVFLRSVAQHGPLTGGKPP
jgi:hypothetical protein